MATQFEAAAHIDVNPRNFRNLLERGVVQRRAASSYDLDEVRVAYIRHLRAAAAGRGGDGGLDLTAERARLAKEQADGTALKNAVVRGEYVLGSEVERRWFDIARGVQARVLGISSNVQQRLAGLTRHDVEEIDRAARQALEETANFVECYSSEGGEGLSASA